MKCHIELQSFLKIGDVSGDMYPEVGDILKDNINLKHSIFDMEII